ncbi:MAG: LTA synthase family protein, partial [Xanthobacteraceae bacterium]
MPPVVALLNNRLAAVAADRRSARRIALLAAIHLAALGVLLWSETAPVPAAAFVLTWGFLNFFWLALLRRPATSAALSLAMIVILILLSQFKHGILMMTITFADVLVIDVDTFSFLLTIIPGLAWKVGLAVLLAIPLLVLLWRLEPFRVRRSPAVAGAMLCFGALAVLSFAVPTDREDEFHPNKYVSKFARSAAVAAVDLSTRGVLEADAAAPERPSLAAAPPCEPAGKLPHIVMVFAESSFDATMMPGVKVGADYHARFRSFDGRTRSFVVEGAGGPSWYTEYNVLAGLSARSFGRFAYYVTQIAAGRVERGLPTALRR